MLLYRLKDKPKSILSEVPLDFVARATPLIFNPTTFFERDNERVEKKRYSIDSNSNSDLLQLVKIYDNIDDCDEEDVILPNLAEMSKATLAFHIITLSLYSGGGEGLVYYNPPWTLKEHGSKHPRVRLFM